MRSRWILIGLTFRKHFNNNRGQKELSKGGRGDFAYSKICVHKFTCTNGHQKYMVGILHLMERMSN